MKAAFVSLMMLCLVALSGCVFGNVDEMYALPQSSELYVNLQDTISKEIGNGEYITTMTGENRQAIQLVDIDADGIQEAVAYYRDNNSETPLKIAIFRQGEDGDYSLYARIDGAGSDIESVEYISLCERGINILVSWRVSASIHTLAVYSVADGVVREQMHSDYEQYTCFDADQDNHQELFLLQPAGDGENGQNLECYDCQDGKLKKLTSASLSETMVNVESWTDGTLADGTPGLFITGQSEDGTGQTDVFILEGNALKKIATETVRTEDGIQSPQDIDEDGIMEIPSGMRIASEKDNEQFQWTKWRRYSSDGAGETALMTYMDPENGWYLELPLEWDGEFSMNRESNAAAGISIVQFARREKTQDEGITDTEPERFLEVSVRRQDNRNAAKNDTVELYRSSDRVYTAKLYDTGWDSGLTKEQLLQAFHPGEGK